MDQSRSIRQSAIVNNVAKSLKDCGKALFLAATGFGKTFCITEHLLPRIQRVGFTGYDYLVHVLVPSTFLEEQWADKISIREKDCKVTTWQAVYDHDPSVPKKKVKVLVVDEWHLLVMAPAYKEALNAFEYDWLVCMTGTLEDEHWEATRKMGIPLVDNVTRDECLRNGWITDWREYNLAVDLSFADSNKLKEIEEKIRRKLLWLDESVLDPDVFGWGNFGMAKKCMTPEIVGFKRLDGKGYIPLESTDPIVHDEVFRKYRDFIKVWKTGKKAGEPLYVKEYAYAKKIADIRGVSDPAIAIKCATDVVALNAMRNDMLYNHPKKIEIVKELISMIPERRGFTFSIHTKMCDALTREIPRTAPYHNSLTTLVVNGKKIGADKQLDIIANKFLKDEYQFLHTIRKIEAGADFPNVDTIINVAYFSKKSRLQQKTGRVIRVEKDKKDKISLIVNLYCRLHVSFKNRNTMETSWLKRAQKESKNVVWVDDVEELLYNYGQQTH